MLSITGILLLLGIFLLLIGSITVSLSSVKSKARNIGIIFIVIGIFVILVGLFAYYEVVSAESSVLTSDKGFKKRNLEEKIDPKVVGKSITLRKGSRRKTLKRR